jgi:hypothetical protein
LEHLHGAICDDWNVNDAWNVMMGQRKSCDKSKEKKILVAVSVEKS